jgi:hypothetical protein
MSLIHGYLLAGLALAGLPILIHLAMRQKPRRLSFPAFRFLKLRHNINRRRMRLQHLLLLALRIGVIAALCFALARPQVQSNAVSWNAEQPVAVVFLFDTSPSMEYQANGVSRLEDARKIALSLMDQMADNSRIVVLDAGDSPETQGDAAAPRNQARTRIKGLSFRPINSTMNAQLPRAYRALEKLATTDPSLPRLLYVFSDRTRASWTADRKIGDAPKDVRSFFVDVGVEEPHDLAIDGVDVNPIVAEPGQEVDVRVTVRATGGKHNTQLDCFMSQVGADSAQQPISREVKMSGGQTEVFAFKHTAPPADSSPIAACQITAKFKSGDALPFNDTRSATFLIRARRSVLTIADRTDVLDTWNWRRVFRSIPAERPLNQTFRCDVERTDIVDRAWKEGDDKPDPLLRYRIACIYQPTKPLSPRLWGRLARFVRDGGNLIVVPPMQDMERADLAAFNREGEALLPSTLVKIVDAPPNRDVFWQAFDEKHPLTRKFADWAKSSTPELTQGPLRPSVRRYWDVQPKSDANVILRYDDGDKDQHPRPALLERTVGKGRVFQFTIPLEGSNDWDNYWTTEIVFGLALVDQVCLYLTPDHAADDVNFVCGHPVEVPLLSQDNSKQYQLKGPVGLTLSETKVPAPGEGRRLLTVPQATHPGNYELRGEGDRIAAAFSVTTPPEESRLERVPPEMIEATLGEGALLPPGKAPRLQDAITDRQPGEIELLPWLLLVVLLVLAVESVLANKFYKRDTAPAEGTGVAVPQRSPAREDAPAQASV